LNLTTSIGKTDGAKLELLCKKEGITKYKFIKNVLLKEIAKDVSEATGQVVWTTEGVELLDRIDANETKVDFLDEP